MSIPTATAQVGATSMGSLGKAVGLQTGAGGTTGANEATGSPYTRVAASSATPDGHGDYNYASVNIPCPAGEYEEGSLWSTLTGSYLSPPSGVAVTAGTGGSLTSGTTYYWKVVGFNWSGTTLPSSEVSLTPTGGNLSGVLNWSALTGVSDQTGIAAFFAGFQIFRGTTAGGENVLVASVAASATSYTDTGAAGTSATPPNSNTASTFVGSSEFLEGTLTVTGTNASINVDAAFSAA